MTPMKDVNYPSKTLVSWYWYTYIKKRVWWFVLAAVLMSIEGATLGLLSYLVRPMFDDVFVGGNRGAVVFVSMIVFAVFFGRAVVGYGQRLLMAYINRNLSAEIQVDLIHHVLPLDAEFYRINPPGQLIGRIRNDTNGMIGIVSSSFSSVGRDITALISLIFVAVSIDWLWTLIALLGAPVVMIPILILQKLIRKTTRVTRNAGAGIMTRLDEIFHGITTIKLNAIEDREAKRYHDQIREMVTAQLRATAATAGIPALMDIVAAIGFLGVLIYGGFQVIDGGKTVGEFMSFFTAIALMFEPMRRLGRLSGAWQNALVSMERVYTVFQQEATILSPEQPKPLGAAPDKSDVVFHNVSLAYGEKQVLENVSFTAEAGKTTALVGASGAGKTTVFGVLSRLVDADSGYVTIGGTDTKDIDLRQLRELMSVVTQDTLLFDETIRENVLLGAEPTEEELNVALEAAHVTDFLPNLGRGVDTVAGPRGSKLSGGQRQRVAIARALLRDTPILLLDEATSALDAKSEAIVQDALERLSQGRTTLVIAHRLATIRGADRIIVMDQGKVVDQGTHAELIKREGVYSVLYQLQFSEDNQE